MSLFGIKLMLVAYCIFNTLWLFVWNYFVKREINLTYTMFVGDVLPYLTLAVTVMFITGFLTSFFGNIYILLVSKIAIAAVLYILIAYIFHSKELFEIADFIFKRNKQS
jgi:hypothetical protein